jgi:hypothetical protein
MKTRLILARIPNTEFRENSFISSRVVTLRQARSWSFLLRRRQTMSSLPDDEQRTGALSGSGRHRLPRRGTGFVRSHSTFQTVHDAMIAPSPPPLASLSVQAGNQQRQLPSLCVRLTHRAGLPSARPTSTYSCLQQRMTLPCTACTVGNRTRQFRDHVTAHRDQYHRAHLVQLAQNGAVLSVVINSRFTQQAEKSLTT